jgi:phosphoenolpyruvate carboxykinase (GTP)
MRVLEWIVDRVEGRAAGTLNAFGTTPSYADIDWDGLDMGPAKFAQLTDVSADEWRTELQLHDTLFGQLAYHLPEQMLKTKAIIEARLGTQ